MRRIWLLGSLAFMVAAAMALSGVAQAASPKAKCQQAAASLGLNTVSYKFIAGSDRKNDDFTSKATADFEVFCGFGGDDYIARLSDSDIFIGGVGDDRVDYNYYGTFYGGEGVDSIVNHDGGTFYGGAGNDYVTNNLYGIFYGEADDDTVYYNSSNGTFDGGEGNDSVFNAQPGGLVLNVP